MIFPKAIVIIPTFNERESIPQTIAAVLKVAETVTNWDIQILVVDDTSPDKTYEVVAQIAQKNPQVHLLLNPVKSGLGGAYLKGMDHAFNQMLAKVVFEFDADLSHDPEKIPAIDAGADMVLGSRYIIGGSIPQNWGLHRKFLSVVGNFFIMVVLTDFRIKDWTSGFRAITKPVFDVVRPKLNSQRFAGYTFQIGFLFNSLRAGFKVVEVPFAFKDRTYGKSKIGPEYIVNNLLFVFKVRLAEIMNHRCGDTISFASNVEADFSATDTYPNFWLNH